MSKPEFDSFAATYEELLKDPIRDGFAGNPAFFHLRKRDLIRDYFKRSAVDTKRLSYLDVGCGKGELMALLAADFGRVAGCDPSGGMLEAVRDPDVSVDVRVQEDPNRIPFDDAQFDFVTAVCVYHHVPVAARAALTREVRRVLKPGGIFAIIEHNPYNPATRLIVKRTPVDIDAILLYPGETQSLLCSAGLTVRATSYFLYLPEGIYRLAGTVEDLLRHVPLGGQYAVFGRREGGCC
jgi:SAM-dependent methyltransferase